MSESKTTPKPNPGSDEAIEQGCMCPVLDNADGKGTPLGFWISDKCPLHGEGIMS